MPAAANVRIVSQYLEYCRRERGRSPQTLYSYATSLRRLLQHIGARNLLDLTPDELRSWVHEPIVRPRGGRAAGSEPSPASVKRKLATLRSLYRWLHEVEGLIRRNPTLALAAPAVHNEQPRPAPEDAWRRLWAADLSDSDRVGFGLAYFCGLRRHEVTLLAPGHVTDLPEARLVGFKRKGGAKASLPWLSCLRMVEAHRPDLIGGDHKTFAEPLARLRPERAGRSTLLSWADDKNPRLGPAQRATVPNGYADPILFNRRLARALRSIGLPPDAFTPHQLRHSFATNLLDMGVPLLAVSRLCGHSSVVVTQRYLKTADDPLASLLQQPIIDLPMPTRFG